MMWIFFYLREYDRDQAGVPAAPMLKVKKSSFVMSGMAGWSICWCESHRIAGQSVESLDKRVNGCHKWTRSRSVWHVP